MQEETKWTLLETLVVVAMIGIVLALVIPGLLKLGVR